MGQELETLLKKWAERRRLDLGPTDEDGRRYFVFDGEYEVAVFQAEARTVLEADIGALPARHGEAETLIARLMELQLARAHRSAETLAVDRTADRLVLMRTLETRGLEAAAFDEIVGAFVNAAAFWTAQRAEQQTARGPTMAPPRQFVFP